jgi:hypothetical protein
MAGQATEVQQWGLKTDVMTIPFGLPEESILSQRATVNIGN